MKNFILIYKSINKENRNPQRKKSNTTNKSLCATRVQNSYVNSKLKTIRVYLISNATSKITNQRLNFNNNHSDLKKSCNQYIYLQQREGEGGSERRGGWI